MQHFTKGRNQQVVNGFRKGKVGELEAVHMLTEHFGNGFKRKKLGEAGSDIQCRPDFAWAVEVKDRNTVKLKHLFKPNSFLLGFWKQAKNQAVNEGKKPLLIIKIEGIWFAIVEFDYKTQRDYITVDRLLMARRFDDWAGLYSGK